MNDILVTIVLGCLATIMSGIAIVVSLLVYHWNRNTSSYSDLDALYMGVLKIGIENPDFRNEAKTTKGVFEGDDLVKYETYAYMVWNVCETVYDRTGGRGGNWKTWKPIIEAEYRLHGKWFMKEENHHKFKEEFIGFVEKEFGGA